MKQYFFHNVLKRFLFYYVIAVFISWYDILPCRIVCYDDRKKLHISAADFFFPSRILNNIHL